MNVKIIMNTNNILFSAIQPTGKLTIGHYLGILKMWNTLQFKYNCFYCIADLHSLTVLNKHSFVKYKVLDLVAYFLASNINPFKNIIFLQSDIIEHMNLYWILSNYTYLGELKRMNQFKDKSKKAFNKNLSLLSYPVLMASDILLYNSNYVCIGYDQIQHIELVRKISKRFNSIYKYKFFNLPNYIISKNFSKIMSLIDIKKKMSKSDINKDNVIFLLDSPDKIEYKIKKSITDSDIYSKIAFDLKNKPGISNLLIILSGIKNISINYLESYFINYNYSSFKKVVYNELINFIISFQEKFFYYRKNKLFLKKILNIGKLNAKKIAKIKMLNLYNLLNII